MYSLVYGGMRPAGDEPPRGGQLERDEKTHARL
jgi:hypothetical protein